MLVYKNETEHWWRPLSGYDIDIIFLKAKKSIIKNKGYEY